MIQGKVKVVRHKEMIAFVGDNTTGWLADKPDGFGHRTTAKCVFGQRRNEGKLAGGFGTCEFVDGDGDKFYAVWTETPDKQTIVSGTGKYDGITGVFEVASRQPHPRPADGEFLESTRNIGSYKLP
jgi:hypothetical protein